METGSFSDYEMVRASWEKIRIIDESFATTGVILFQNVFTIKPDALELFSLRRRHTQT